MKGDAGRRAPTTIGALTRKDRRRESALVRKIDDAYSEMARTSSKRRRRRHLRSAHRTERALDAQRRRPQSLLYALALVLLGTLVLIAATHASFTLAVAIALVLAADVLVLRVRRRTLRGS